MLTTTSSRGKSFIRSAPWFQLRIRPSASRRKIAYSETPSTKAAKRSSSGDAGPPRRWGARTLVFPFVVGTKPCTQRTARPNGPWAEVERAGTHPLIPSASRVDATYPEGQPGFFTGNERPDTGGARMVIVELCCDHSDCVRLNRVLATVSDIVQARQVIEAGGVRCPLHGVRADPIVVGRPHPTGR